MKLQINPKLKELLSPLTAEEDRDLAESLSKNGQWLGFPLTVSPDGDVCDGMNRYEKLTAKNIEPKYVVDETLDTFEKKALFVIKNNLARRHLNNWQKGQHGLQLMKFIDPQNSGYRADKAIKEVPGLKLRTFEKIIQIDKKAPDSIKKKLSSGSMSVDTAYKLVTKEERNLPKVPAPEGEFDVILCDVPLAFENETVRGAAENHYPTMSVEELCSFKVPSAKNAIMFFWISPTRIDDGKTILAAWNFNSKDYPHFIWPKDKWGNGSWMRNQHEDLLIAIKGKMPTPAKLFSSIIEGKRTEHSKKPEIYDMIETMYPKRKYLELFSRFKDSRTGWTFHGNEIKIVDENNPFQDPKQMKKLEKAFDKRGSKSHQISAEENDKTDKSSWGSQKDSKSTRKKKEITVACADCLEVFHSKDDLKKHKENSCPKRKPAASEKPIDKIRNASR